MVTPDPNPTRKSRPVILVGSILVFLQIVTAGAAFGDVVGKDTAAFMVLVTAAIQAALAFYVQSQVVPLQDSAAYVNTDGKVVAGPASPPQVIDGEAVEVTPVS